MKLKIVVLALVVALSGCAGPQTHALLSQTDAPDTAIAGRHEIFVATTRKRAADARQVFDNDRSGALNYARVDISVPKTHEIGRIERAKGSKAANPARDFAVSKATLYDTAPAFAKEVSADVARRGDRLLVFVHGYNTGFDGAIYRVTQIAHDTGYPGTPVLFSWASGAKTTDYIYDKESANAARDDLEETLRLLAKTRARSIDIIAHSMGTWVAMEALRQLALTGDRDLGGKLGYVILASPDIDVDVFKKQMQRYGKPETPFAILLSGDDRALKLSGLLAGERPRLGGYKDSAEIASYGVTVVDLTNTKAGDKLNHAKFADNPILVQLLGDRLRAPASLEPDEAAAQDKLNQLGNAMGSVASIIVTTPFRMFTVGSGR